MKPIKLLTPFLALLTTAINVKAQSQAGSLANGLIPEVTPPSAEGSSIGKYGAYSVSPYTGLPQISIPIYNVEAKDISVPIELSYHGAGVKVDDVESWAGVNWTLNCGGAITRTVVGLEDDKAPGGFLYRNQHAQSLKTSYSFTNPDDWLFFRKIQERLFDTEPDIFFYNFGGHSGKFFFDEAGNFHCTPVNTLKLLKCPINNTINTPTDKYWQVADETGTIYQFGANNLEGIEKTQVFKDAPNASEMKITAWYLTQIISPNKTDTIFFHYTNKTDRYDLPYQQSYRVKDWDDGFPMRDTKANVVLYNGMRTPDAFRNSFMASGISMLSEINWPSGRAQFTTQARSDIQMMMLTNISIFNQNNSKIRSFDFKYGIAQNRYYLDTLTESGMNTSVSLKHSFEYVSRTLLPLRLTNGINSADAQDHGAISTVAQATRVPFPIKATWPYR